MPKRCFMQAHPSVNHPTPLPLWPGPAAPGAREDDGPFPNLTFYLPSEEYRTGTTVLILPGGGYGLVSTAKEGHRPAQLLNAHGIAAAVLEYRHAPHRHPIPLLDAQRAMRVLHQQATQHGLNPTRIGVLGFSAGGHLAGSLATQPAVTQFPVNDAIDALPFAPAFAALLYPVVSFTAPFAHKGSRKNLLPESDDTATSAQLAAQLSIEQAVTANTPPMFLVHAQDDHAVSAENSIALWRALTRANVPAELHLYPTGGHGFGLAANHPWGHLLLRWLETIL